MWLGSGQQLDKIDISEVSIMSTHVSVEHTARDLGVIFDSRLTMADHVAACRMSLWLLPTASAPPSGTFSVSWWRQGSGPCLHFVQAWLLQLTTYWRHRLPASSITVAPECGRLSCYRRSSTWTHYADTQASSLATSASTRSVQAGNPGIPITPTIASSLLNPEGGHSDQRNDPSVWYNATTTPSATDHSQ